MEYKTFDCKSYKVHTIKTDRFKSCLMTIIFRKNITDDNELTNLNLLAKCMNENTKTYKSLQELAIKTEELYNIYFNAAVGRLGKSYDFSFDTEFINPEYIKEKEYLDECMDYIFDSVLNPNVENDEFDLKTFNLVKDRLIQNVERLHESPFKQSLRNAIKLSAPNTHLANYMTKEKIEKSSPTKLYKLYKDMISKANCEIYIIGNLDMEEIVSKINERFKLKSLKTEDILLYDEIPVKKKPESFYETDSYVQANLIQGYNILDLNKKDKMAIRFFIEIFSGLNSKLFRYLREENSLCYSVNPIYYKYDKVFAIHVSLEEKNIPKALELMKKAMNEMVKGDISEDEFMRAKKSLQFSFKMTNDSNSGILRNYIFANLGEVPILSDYEDEFDEIGVEDVQNIAKKLKINFTYVLGKGEENEKN